VTAVDRGQNSGIDYSHRSEETDSRWWKKFDYQRNPYSKKKRLKGMKQV
jgi:hypothetical protein